MTLSNGTKLGQYEVIEAIGAGGMGEVYRARDTKLGRDVAIKVLPEEFARDKERLDRFEREARLLAQLNHSNIATLHGLEEHDGQKFLVMELIEGETLAERIAQGPLPLDEAIPLFIQIAEGLEAAHEKGIIHRDLKPANIKIGSDGKPKILDFGLAKAFVGDEEPTPDLSQSPTLTKGTAVGAIMGTASYMSPEQARGKIVDKRTDIWAFACCLFEALTGERAFEGETVADVLGSVVKSEPRFERLPRDVPIRIHELVRSAFVKDPLERLRDIGDARIAMRAERSVVAEQAHGHRGSTRLLPWAITAVAVVAALAMWVSRGSFPTRSSRPVRFTVELPSNQRPAMDLDVAQITLSRDGSRVAWIGAPAPTRQIYTRAIDELVVRAVSGTEDVANNFLCLSPDGAWVAFVRDGALWKTEVDGGIPVKLFQGETDTAIWWGDWLGDEIILSLAFSGLVRIPADGGDAAPLTSVDRERNEVGHAAPHVLPGGDAILYTRYIGNFNDAEVAVLDRRTGRSRILFDNGYNPSYVSSGHIVYAWEGVVFAVPFDAEELMLRGPRVPVLDGVQMDIRTGRMGQVAVSENGNVVYVPNAQGFDQRRVAWVDRDGRTERLPLPAALYDFPSLSPDGESYVLLQREHHVHHVAIYDRGRGVLRRFTFEGTWNLVPIWSPDGSSIAFGSNRAGPLNLFVKSTTSGTVEHLQSSHKYQYPLSWSPDGCFLMYQDRLPGDQYDVWLFPMDGDATEPIPLLASEANETHGRFSPAGGWFAYVSTEEGRAEVFIQDVSTDGSTTGQRVKVSPDGGWQPVWSHDGSALFYRSLDGTRLHAVDIQTEPTLRVGNVNLLLENLRMPPPDWWADIQAPFDVGSDGRFLMVLENELPETVTMIVFLDWLEELERLAPANN